ncbi:MAG TPA: TrkA C-terminal domain-containing protein, partial [Acidimicrobiales bacterium]|nr:TrkA C-terminal domain-containing protein [Acidimicrobiales bacterium]
IYYLIAYGVMTMAAFAVIIIRERHVIVPRGETVFEAGDEVLVLVTPESEDVVKTLFVGSAAVPSAARGARSGD